MKPIGTALDALRFRLHPCFRHPSDPPACPNRSLHVWPVDAGKIVLTSMAGIAFIEIFADGDEICTAYFDYMNGDLGNSNGMPKQITITEDGIRARLPDNRRKATRLKLVIFSSSLHSHIVEDLSRLKSKDSLVKLSNNQVGYRSNMLGTHSFPGSVSEDLILDFAVIQTKLLTSLKVYHDPFSISGIEFCYEDATTQFFGNRDPQSTNTSEYVLDTRKGELLTGFYVRATQKVEGIGVITNMGKINGVCGNATAGIGHTLIAPRGYKIAGVSGTFSESIDTFSLIISR
ncbi:metallopeptidase [Coccidioides immitis RMSCC 3703]|uniref:Metallopeptidase n=1 Tax=Coccidioides immitis RMSCC 3703 TaxID=454286 RepID=A0A0J8R5F7_COCIT|nr:metallopeptidase [Coccidioides immitis RMSCC 3703]